MGSSGLLSLSTSSRKFLPLRSDAWKVIFQVLIMLSFSNFLLKSHEYLFGNRGVRLNNFVSELTALWRCQLLLLGHFQNSIVFVLRWLKNSLSSNRMELDCFWSMCKDGSKIFLAMWIESVIMMILEVSCERTAWLILYLMAKNSASWAVMLIAWWRVLTTGLYHK